MQLKEDVFRNKGEKSAYPFDGVERVLGRL